MNRELRITLIEGSRNKEELVTLATYLAVPFLNHLQLLATNMGLKQIKIDPKVDVMLREGKTSSRSKKDLATLVATLLEPENFAFFLKWDNVPKNFEEFICDLLSEDKISLPAIKRKYGFEPYILEDTGQKYSPRRISFKPYISLFKIHTSFYNASSPDYYAVSCYDTLKQVMVYALPNNPFQQIPTQAAPPAGALFNCEATIFEDLTKINHATNAQMIDFSSKIPIDSTLKKVREKLGISEFYPTETNNKKVAVLRMRLLIGLIRHILGSETDGGLKQINGMMKALKAGLQMGYFSQLEGYDDIENLLPHIKGLGHAYNKLAYNDKEFRTSVWEGVKKILLLIPEGQWITTDALLRYVSFHGLHVSPISKGLARSYLYISSKEGGYSEKNYINEDAYRQTLSVPLLKGYIALLTAMGGVEAVLDPVNEESESYYEGIQAFRITPLGNYLLGKSSSYKAPKVKLGANIALSDSDLMVLLSEPDSIKSAILTNFATQVTPLRFLVSTASFLKECATAEDIEVRWATFFNALGIDDEPANWTKFYHAMLKKAIVLKELQDVKVIQLPPDDKELLQLIATHPNFKKMLVKAEGMKVVVYASHYKAFVNLLKEMGYLISISITG